MSGAYNRSLTGRQPQPPPPRKRRLVNYYMQRLSEQPGYSGQREDGHRFGVNRILPFGDNGLLSAGRDGVVRLWDVSAVRARVGGLQTEEDTTSESSRCSAVFASHTDWVTGLAVAAGRIMASCSNDGTLKIWDLAAASPTSGAARDANFMNTPMRKAPGRPGLSDDVEEESEAEEGEDEGGGRGGGRRGGGGDRAGSPLTRSTLSSNRENGGKAVKAREEGDRRVYEAEKAPARPGPLATVSGHGDYVKCLTYAPDAGVLVSGGLDKRIVLWDLQRVTAPLMVLRPGDAEDEASSPTSSSTASLSTSSVSGTAAASGTRGWKNRGGALRSGSDGKETGAWRYLRDPSRVVLRSGMASAGPNELFELCRQKKGSVYCVDASADGALVASGGTDRMIRLLDPRAGAGHAAKICKLDGHRENVRCVRIDEGGTRVVSGSTDGTIRVWDVRQQCCLGFYDLPGGAVWAMHPSPCDFDVYYSGGRGRRVYRTDFRTGQSVLMCMTDSEVLDMAVEFGGGSSNGGAEDKSMVMWLSSTGPDIGLWGGVAGGGEILRTGVAKGPPPSGTSTASSLKVVDGVEGAAPVDGTYVLRGPVEALRGHPGVVRHAVLNNRRHVLTEDNANPPNVSLWDVTKAKQVEVFPPGTIMEEKERALTEIIAVRPWFAVDTHLGTPFVTLAESTAFDGELYAVDASGERRTLLHDPFPPSTSLEEPQQRLSVALRASSGAKGGVVGGRRPGNGVARPAKARSMQDEVKVNLGEAVLRGLFSRWIEQPFRSNGSGRSQSRRGLERNGSCSSGESDDDVDSDGQDHTSTNSSRSGTLRSRTSSGASSGDRGNGGGSGNSGDGGERSKRSGGADDFPGREGLDLDLMNSSAGDGLGGGRGIGDDTVLWVTETDLGGNGGIQRTLLQKRVGEFDGREGEDAIPNWVVSCVIHGEFPTKEQPKVAFFLAPWVPPESTNSVGKRAGSADEAGAGASASASGGSHQASQRYTAPAQMQISKVMAYVLTHADLRQHLDGTGPKVGNGSGGSGEGGATSSFPPEDIVEVLCGSCVLEPHLYVGAIQQYIWNPNASGTLSLHYRSRWRSST